MGRPPPRAHTDTWVEPPTFRKYYHVSYTQFQFIVSRDIFQDKCGKYWPDQDEPVFYGNIVVSVISESNMTDYIVKIFEVKLVSQHI